MRRNRWSRDVDVMGNGVLGGVAIGCNWVRAEKSDIMASKSLMGGR